MENRTVGRRLKDATKKVGKVILLVGAVVLIGFFSFRYWGVYDEGIKAGTVLRLSKKGILFKTYEGQLNLGTFGALKGASPIAEAFDFSVENDNEQTIKDLESVALSGERVNLHYIKRYSVFAWRGDTKYFVTKVERLK